MLQVIQNFTNSLTIGKKMLVVFLLLVVVPLIASALIFSNILSDSTTGQIENASRQYVQQVVLNTENALQQIDNMMLSFLWDQDIQTLLQQEFSNSNLRERNSQTASVLDKMQLISNSQLGVELIYLSRIDNEEYAIATSVEAKVLAGKFWYLRDTLGKYATDTNGRINWGKLMRDDQIVLGVRDVYDIETVEKTGLIVMGIHEEQIANLYTNLKTTPGSVFILFDRDGQVISSDMQGEFEKQDFYFAASESASWNQDIDGYNVIASKSDYSGWTIVQATPNDEIMRVVNKTRFIIFGIILFALAVLMFLVQQFTNTMVKPIRQMMGEMDKVKREDFNVYADESRGDEFGDLAEDFNVMVGKIQRLIEEDYKKRLVLQEAEYKYLRAQINPHFIYNTLDSINWMALQTGQRDISKVSISLGRLLRRSIAGKEDTIELHDELDGIRDYITIQKMRYGERLNFEIDISDEYLNCVIPRSSIQPIVENALVHGLEKKAKPGHIRITASHEDNTLRLCVEDDGVGMSEERVAQAMAGNITDTGDSHTGVGIKNVHKRICLLFGMAYGVEIESDTGVGTRVILKIPVKLEQDLQRL